MSGGANQTAPGLTNLFLMVTSRFFAILDGTVFFARLCRRYLQVAVLAIGLFIAIPQGMAAEPFVSYKYQDYAETRDRIRVVSHHLMGHANLGASTQIQARALVDTITGATPNGQPAPEGSDQVVLSDLEDERYAFVADATHDFGNSRIMGELSYSTESDYDSIGIAGSFTQSFFQKNTEVQFGISYVDDDIQPTFFPEARRKISKDFLVGLTQLLGPNTTFTANLSYGTADGYLSDPYKLVQKSIELLPGLSLPLTFQENRPDSREKIIGYFGLAHYFEGIRGSVDASFRLYDDDHGIGSTTTEISWYQKFGEKLVVRPSFRFYRQSAADYYYYNLDFTPIIPVSDPDGSAPNYSSDYRVSYFDSVTLGLKAVYSISDRWAVDAMYERYEMIGRDGTTPDSAYPAANILTLGVRAWF